MKRFHFNNALEALRDSDSDLNVWVANDHFPDYKLLDLEATPDGGTNLLLNNTIRRVAIKTRSDGFVLGLSGVEVKVPYDAVYAYITDAKYGEKLGWTIEDGKAWIGWTPPEKQTQQTKKETLQ